MFINLDELFFLNTGHKVKQSGSYGVIQIYTEHLYICKFLLYGPGLKKKAHSKCSLKGNCGIKK